MQSMSDDFYRHDAERFMLIGEDRGRTFRLGEPIRVRIISVTPAETRIDMELA